MGKSVRKVWYKRMWIYIVGGILFVLAIYLIVQGIRCNMAVKPIMVELPYPEIRVREKNQTYANLLSIDYCGATSELSAITQYINNENRLSCEKCPIAKTILGIAMAEMIHLQKLGELIFLLGGCVDFTARQRNGKEQMWTPQYITIPEEASDRRRGHIQALRIRSL